MKLQHRINPLTPEQFKSLDNLTNQAHRPVRFVCRKKSVNITNGILEGGNILYQTIYWDRPQSWVKQVLEFLRQNNPNETIKITYH
jgi:hypothetical protein